MPARFWGWFWVVLGLGLTLADPIFGWFHLKLMGIYLPIGILALVYGAIVLIYYRKREAVIVLTPEDMEEHGPLLEAAVPMIMALLEKKTPTKDLVEIVEAKKGLPKEITYKYIITLGREMKGQNK
jgi:hypothetical protein